MCTQWLCVSSITEFTFFICKKLPSVKKRDKDATAAAATLSTMASSNGHNFWFL